VHSAPREAAAPRAGRHVPAVPLLAAAAIALLACRAPDAELWRIRRAIASCPVPLTDAALDDLSTYEACALPPSVTETVRNDYADDELEVPDLAALQRHAGEVPRSVFEAQLRRFVDPRKVLAAYVEIDAARGLLRPDPVLAPEVVVPFAPEPEGTPTASWCAPDGCAGRLQPPLHPDHPYREARRAELLALPRTALRPLEGVRVIVDPGHAGGAFGPFEERQVIWRPGRNAPGVPVQEGDVTLRTALELRDKLRTLGAEVVLTRDAPGPVHPLPPHAFRPYAERLLRRIALDPAHARLEAALAPEDRLRLRTALSLFAVKKQHRFESLRARARVATAARADLVLSVHYNAAPASGGGRRGAQEVVAMVRGFHLPGRLYQPYHRWRALEGAFAVDDFGASAHLGALCVQAMSERLGLPVAAEPRYDDHLPIRDARGRPVGVDAWDGALLRYLDGPAVLTEGPALDDPDELPRLQAALAAPPGTPGTRTDRYADALASCVQSFTARWLGAERNPFGPFP
jgi:N-acetylmuramoyl-L-alanine amidase